MPSAWVNEWNNIIRDLIFADEELKTLMKIPEGTTIINFIDSYFIRAGYAGKVLTNQAVRIVYGVPYAEDTNNPNVKRNSIDFDIYVKDTEAHNVCNDRLVFRNQMIAERLIQLLLRSGKTYGYKFNVKFEGDFGTSTIGYSRYKVSFYYMRTF